ncbi:MAG: O-antigen ligase family protein [Candidatus Coatesbacteria bacterium]|nr:O-antigen ligase family protein [Candidatus Coatesbacteria bacterium]
MAKKKLSGSVKSIDAAEKLEFSKNNLIIFIPFAVFFLGISFFGFNLVQTTTSAKPFIASISFIMLGLCTLLIIKNIIKDDDNWSLPNSFFVILVFFLYQFVNHFLVSSYPHSSVREMVFQILYLFAFTWGFFAIRNSFFKRLAPLFMILTGVLVVLNGILKIMGINIAGYSGDIGTQMASTMGNPNYLAGYLILLIPVACALTYNTSRDNINRWSFYIPVSALLIIGLFLTRGRGALIAFFIAILIGAWYNMKKGKARTTIAYTAGLLILILILIRFTKPMWLAPLAAGTLKVRLIIWQGAWKSIIDKPLFGWGIGTFREVFPFYRSIYYALNDLSTATDHAHCGYLEILQNSGIIGLFLYVTMFYFITKSFKKIWEDDKDKNRYLAFGLAGGILAALIENQIGVNQYIFPVYIIFWLQVGMLEGLASGKKEGFIKIPLAYRKMLTIISTTILIVLGAYNLRYFYNAMISQKSTKLLEKVSDNLDKELDYLASYLEKMEKEGKKAEYYSQPLRILKEGEKEIETALKADPFNFSALYQSAGFYFRFSSWYMLQKKYHDTLGGDKVIGDTLKVREKEIEALDKALQYYLRLEKIAPRYAELQHNIAMLLYQKSDYNGALSRLGIAANQDIVTAREHIDIIIKNGLPSKYDNHENRMTIVKSISIIPRLSRGQAQLDFSRLPAEQMYDRWKKIQEIKKPYRYRKLGNQVTALAALIRTLNLTKEETSEAITIVMNTIKMRSFEMGELASLLGYLYERNGELENAELAYTWSLNYEPDNVSTRVFLMLLYSRMEKKQKEYKELEEMNQEFMPILKGYFPVP